MQYGLRCISKSLKGCVVSFTCNFLSLTLCQRIPVSFYIFPNMFSTIFLLRTKAPFPNVYDDVVL